MGDTANDLTALLGDLEALMGGRLSVAEFRMRYQTNGGPSLLDSISENLEHYLSDGKRRAQDPAYRRMQDDELRKLIRLMETGAPPEQLARITFLASSDE